MAESTATAPVLQLHDVSKKYGSLRVLDSVSLTVQTGECRAVIGPNGAGKSTLFNVITGSVTASSGRVVYRGTEVTSHSEARRSRAGMAKTFQHSSVFHDLSVRENIRIAVHQAQQLGLSAWASRQRKRSVDRLEDELLETSGLGDLSGLPAGALSHGQKRQLELVLATSQKPDLLLLDEPAAGMSLSERQALIASIRAMRSQSTVILIEHDIDLVFEVATTVSVLAAGELIADGHPDEVRSSQAVHDAYLGTEQRGEVFHR